MFCVLFVYLGQDVDLRSLDMRPQSDPRINVRGGGDQDMRTLPVPLPNPLPPPVAEKYVFTLYVIKRK